MSSSRPPAVATPYADAAAGSVGSNTPARLHLAGENDVAEVRTGLVVLSEVAAWLFAFSLLSSLSVYHFELLHSPLCFVSRCALSCSMAAGWALHLTTVGLERFP